MLKTLSLAVGLSLGATLSAQATTVVAFDDFTLETNGGDGSVAQTTTAPGFDFSFRISGSDTETVSYIDTNFIAILPANTVQVFFDWSYSTLITMPMTIRSATSSVARPSS